MFLTLVNGMDDCQLTRTLFGCGENQCLASHLLHIRNLQWKSCVLISGAAPNNKAGAAQPMSSHVGRHGGAFSQHLETQPCCQYSAGQEYLQETYLTYFSCETCWLIMTHAFAAHETSLQDSNLQCLRFLSCGKRHQTDHTPHVSEVHHGRCQIQFQP